MFGNTGHVSHPAKKKKRKKYIDRQTTFPSLSFALPSRPWCKRKIVTKGSKTNRLGGSVLDLSLVRNPGFYHQYQAQPSRLCSGGFVACVIFIPITKGKIS